MIEVGGAKIEAHQLTTTANCLTFIVKVREFRPPAGVPSGFGYPPVKEVEFFTGARETRLEAVALHGGGGGGGGVEDNRVWMTQELYYSLPAEIPEGQATHLIALVTLNEAFGIEEPVQFEVDTRAGPGGLPCPYPSQ
jgi:hypothetical protein